MTAAAVKAAPGCREPFSAPPVEACSWCDGAGLEPDIETSAVPCLQCDGVGVEPARFDLPRSRTCAKRSVRYKPLCGAVGTCTGKLYIGTARSLKGAPKWDGYWLAEVGNDWGGRSFRLAKVGDTEVYCVFLGPGGAACDCGGDIYQNAAKANARAAQMGGEVYDPHCKHLAALGALAAAGYFRL
jgi:hypothetical protein